MGTGSLRSIEGVQAAGYGGGCEGQEASQAGFQIFVLDTLLEGCAIH